MLKTISRLEISQQLFENTKVHLLCDASFRYPPYLLFLKDNEKIETINLLNGKSQQECISYNFNIFPNKYSLDNNSPHGLNHCSWWLQLMAGSLYNTCDTKQFVESGVLKKFPEAGRRIEGKRKYFVYYDGMSKSYFLYENLDFKG